MFFKAVVTVFFKKYRMQVGNMKKKYFHRCIQKHVKQLRRSFLWKKVNNWEPLTILEKFSILDAWQGCEYAFAVTNAFPDIAQIFKTVFLKNALGRFFLAKKLEFISFWGKLCS